LYLGVPVRVERPVTLPDTANKFRTSLLEWAEDNTRDFPWRDTNRPRYEGCLAEFFLTQTPADNVAKVYPTFIDRYPSLEAIDSSDSEELESVIEPLGFQRMRTRALKSIADSVDTLPGDSEQLQELERVGPYVANATLCFADRVPVPILDRNVERIYNRVFGDQFPDTRRDREEFCAEILPENPDEARQFNLALLDFGATVCSKQNPDCDGCFASEYCVYVAEEG